MPDKNQWYEEWYKKHKESEPQIESKPWNLETDLVNNCEKPYVPELNNPAVQTQKDIALLINRMNYILERIESLENKFNLIFGNNQYLINGRWKKL